MGSTVCAAVSQADDLELVAAVSPSVAGRLLGEVCGAAGSGLAGLAGRAAAIEVAADPSELPPGSVDVAVDFTVRDAALRNLHWCAENGVHAVSGTTGFSVEEVGGLEAAFSAEASPNCLLAANFSIGALLMMRCAELCAPYFEGVEVIELHHDRKQDAPSGTSLETVRRIEVARSAHAEAGPFSEDQTKHVSLEGARGGVTGSGIHLHSVRLPGLVAHQQVMFGSLGETLTLRHDSVDRVSFMPGVLLAIRRVGTLPGLTLGLESLLD
jgi:4-hydroxy-tetrahydrodipicolinate reductase